MSHSPQFRRALSSIARGDLLIAPIKSYLYDPNFPEFEVKVGGLGAGGEGTVRRTDLSERVRAVEAVGVGVDAARFQRGNFFEASFAIYLIVKGFRPSPILTGPPATGT